MATFLPADARSGGSTLLTWVVFALNSNGAPATKYFRWSHIDIPDTNNGMIQARVKSWGRAIRALSDRLGNTESSRFQFTIIDHDRALLSLMGDANYRYMYNRIVTMYMLTDAERRSGVAPYEVAKGVVRKITPGPNRLLTFECQDYLSSEFSNAGDEEIVPRRIISRDWLGSTVPDGIVGLPEPQIYGEVTETGSIADQRGRVPCLPCGTEVISSVTWNRFLIQGAASKSILNLFSGGNVWDTGQAGVDVLMPGYAGWPFGTLYRDYTFGSVTRRYTMIYARGPYGDNAASGSAPLTCNLQGIEDAGNGTGTLIGHIIDQFYHWYINFGILDWQSGAWLANPNFHPIEDLTLRVNQASFTQAKSALQTRVFGGYQGTTVIGSNGELVKKGEIIKRFAMSADIRYGFNRLGQFSVFVPDLTTSVADHTQMNDILKGTFVCVPMDEDMKNVIPFSYSRNWRENSWDVENSKAVNGTSVTGYKTRREDSPREFWYLTDAASAQNNAGNQLRRVQYTYRAVSYEAKPYVMAQCDLGNTVQVTHLDGPDGAGWVDRNVFVDRIEYSPQGTRTAIGGFDIDNMGAASYTIESGFKGSGSPLSFSVTATPELVASYALMTGQELGGDRHIGRRSASYIHAWNYRVVKVNWNTVPDTFTVNALVEVKTNNATTSVTPRIIRTDNVGVFQAIAGTGSPQTNTAWNTPPQTIVLARGTGIEYFVLQQIGGNANEDTFAFGRLEPVAI